MKFICYAFIQFQILLINKTSLHIACEKGYAEIVSLLLTNRMTRTDIVDYVF